MALIDCPECGNQVSEAAESCPNCGFPVAEIEVGSHKDDEETGESGESEKEERPWYEQGVWITFWLVLFLPVGLYALYKNEWMSKSTKNVILGLIGGFFTAFILDRMADWMMSPEVPSSTFSSFYIGLVAFLCILFFFAGLIKPSLGLPWLDSPSRSRVAAFTSSVFLAVLVAGSTFTEMATNQIEDSWTQQEYEAGKDKVLRVVDSLLEAGEPIEALDTINAYSVESDQPLLDSLNRVAQADTLYQSVLQIPASEVEKNIEMYERLFELDPNRDLFKQKLAHYREIKEQQERAAERKRQQKAAERQREYMYSEAWGNDNKVTAWTMCQNFVEDRLRSPSTASYPWSWSDDTHYVGNGRFRINSYVDAQNAFGGEVRTEFMCEVEHKSGDRWGLVSLNMN